MLAFLDAVSSLELHSFVLYRAGAVVAEGYWHPYAADIPHAQHSATKSWNATAIGILIGEQRLSLTDKVIDFFPDDLPEVVSDNLAAMTVEDLLTMCSGHRTGISGGEWRGSKASWVRAFLREPVPDRPGETFIYSSGSSYMLSAIATKVTGRLVAALLTEKLFTPLQMGPIDWDVSPEGFNTGGNGLTCLTEDVVKFGALYLADGIWNGKRILPEGWVKAASSPFVTDAWIGTLDGKRFLPREMSSRAMGGYGYQWWLTAGVCYRASGVYGQLCIVLPGHDAVIVTTAAIPPREPSLLPLILQHLVPALDRAGDQASDDALALRLSALQIPRVEGAPGASRAADLSGRSFAMQANEDQVSRVSFLFGQDDALFTLHDHRGSHQLRVGLVKDVMGDTTMTGNILHHEYQPDSLRVLGRGAWQDQDTFVMEWRFIETAFCDVVTCRFAGDSLTLERRVNTNAGPLSRPALVGHAA